MTCKELDIFNIRVSISSEIDTRLRNLYILKNQPRVLDHPGSGELLGFIVNADDQSGGGLGGANVGFLTPSGMPKA